MNVQTQFDYKGRIVSLRNLEAMCHHISGTVHVFKVSRVNEHSCYVTYSNPDEQGTPHPITAVFPCWRNGQLVSVLLEFKHVIGDRDGEEWMLFEQLRQCSELWCDPRSNRWIVKDNSLRSVG